MNILILNWRDIKNPQAGGAEQLTHEIAKRWVRRGYKVTQISSGYSGAKGKETIDGVQIIRLGRWWNVHLLAFLYYAGNLRKNVDIIIDEVHWFPFFSLLYAPKKTVLLVCEVANNLFYQIFPWPIAVLWRGIEKLYLQLYRNIPTFAISPSTKKDLVKEGFDEKKITVLPMGVSLPKDIQEYQKLPKEKNPTLIYLGRINKQKGAEDALEAFRIVRQKIPKAKLWFAGGGKKEYIRKLKAKSSKLKLKDLVVFHGYVSEERKFELLAKAHILIVPSIHEGWGLIVPEAGAVGTPAAVYNVSGLRDVIRDGVNGIVVEPAAKNMAVVIIKLLHNKGRLKKISSRAVTLSKEYNWDKTVKVFSTVLHRVVENNSGR